MENKIYPARYLLIGEAPSRKHGKRNLDVCLVCRALGRHPGPGTLGWLRTQHRDLFSFVLKTKHINLIDHWPGSSGKGSAFPIEDAKFTASTFKTGFHYYNAVFLAGKRVAKVFDVKAEYFDKVEGNTPMYVVPHPSGINTWWNDPCNREVAKKFLKQFAAD
jgi:hypothetical protein